MRRRFTKTNQIECVSLVDRCWRTKPLTSDEFLIDNLDIEQEITIVYNGITYMSLYIVVLINYYRNFLGGVEIPDVLKSYRCPFLYEWERLFSEVPYTANNNGIHFDGDLTLGNHGILTIDDLGNIEQMEENIILPGSVWEDPTDGIVYFSLLIWTIYEGELHLIGSEQFPIDTINEFAKTYIPVQGVKEDYEVDPDSGLSDRFHIEPKGINASYTEITTNIRYYPDTAVIQSINVPPWVTYIHYPAEDRIEITISKNSLIYTRTGVIIITNTDGETLTYSIHQSGKPAVYTPTSYSLSYQQTGRNASITDITSQGTLVAFVQNASEITVSRDGLSTFEYNIAHPFTGATNLRIHGADNMFLLWSDNKICMTTDFITYTNVVEIMGATRIFNVAYKSSTWGVITDGTNKLHISTDNGLSWAAAPMYDSNGVYLGIAPSGESDSNNEFSFKIRYCRIGSSTTKIIRYHFRKNTYSEVGPEIALAGYTTLSNDTYWLAAPIISDYTFFGNQNGREVYQSGSASTVNRFNTAAGVPRDGAVYTQTLGCIAQSTGSTIYTSTNSISSWNSHTTQGATCNCVWYSTDMNVFMVGHNAGGGFTIVQPVA